MIPQYVIKSSHFTWPHPSLVFFLPHHSGGGCSYNLCQFFRFLYFLFYSMVSLDLECQGQAICSLLLVFSQGPVDCLWWFWLLTSEPPNWNSKSVCSMWHTYYVNRHSFVVGYHFIFAIWLLSYIIQPFSILQFLPRPPVSQVIIWLTKSLLFNFQKSWLFPLLLNHNFFLFFFFLICFQWSDLKHLKTASYCLCQEIVPIQINLQLVPNSIV